MISVVCSIAYTDLLEGQEKSKLEVMIGTLPIKQKLCNVTKVFRNKSQKLMPIYLNKKS